LLPMRSVSVSAFFALGFVSPLVAAQVSAWGQCEYREKVLIVFCSLTLLFIVW